MNHRYVHGNGDPADNPSTLPTASTPDMLMSLPSLTGGNSASSSKRHPIPPSLPTNSKYPVRNPETLGTLIEVRESPGRGKGVFALVDIPPRSAILYESPILILIDTGTRADPLCNLIAALSRPDRTSFFSLHHYSTNPHESLGRSIVYSNSFAVISDMHSGVFETGSRFNHSCVPNTYFDWIPLGDGETGRMLFWNKVKLLAGDELTISYGHTKARLKKNYGFDCCCGGCIEGAPKQRVEDTEEEVNETKS